MKKEPTLIEQAEFYDEFWANYPIKLGGWEVLRLSAVLKAISEILSDLYEETAVPRICDLGCGRGWLAGELAKFGNVVGVDLSPEGIRLAQARWPKVEFQVQDILQWRPVQQFDLVVSSEVIEHIVDKQQFVEAIHSMVRPRGYAILTTPNRLQKAAWDRVQLEQQAVEEWSTPSELRALFADRFDVLSHETFLLDANYTGIHRFTSAPKVLKAVKSLGLRHLYDGLRKSLGMGLFQVLVAQRRS
jgi:SAM-dependent methyltransferase